MTGQLFGDRYQVGDTLGFGGMSEVHRGRDLRLGRDVAIKVLRADLARDPSFQIRFRREAQNAASLNHPAIVAVYDTGETTGANGTDKVPYIVMEYVDGETLRDLLKREGPLAPKRAMEIVADVSAALDFSHRHGIVHRDIKPANIMLTRAGAVKVMDFGIARAVADGQSSVTATAAVIGTAQYLSPEQARGEAVDARSDVYSTGCVIYELITGAPPFIGDSPVAVAYQHVREDPKPPSTVKPGLPREMDAIVLKALNKNPLNRYQTAAEMRADLVRALSGQAVQAPRVMDDAERTEILGSSSRGGPQRVGAGVSSTPPILAAPRKFTEQWEDDDDDDASRTKKIWGYVGIGAICLALLAGAILLTVKFTSGPKPIPDVVVPDLRSKTQEEAARILTSNKFQLSVDPSAVPGENADKGKVVSQNPSGGTPRQPNTTVTVKIGAGVLNVTVPNLAGLSTDAATKTLQSLGLAAKANKVESETSQIDQVLKQDPVTGKSVPPGTTVTFNVGAGPTLVEFPDGLVGLQLSDAQAKLQALKLQVRPNLVDSVEPANQVIAVQGYKPGQKVAENEIVILDVSKFNLFVMPDVSTNRPSEEEARQTLAAAQFGNQATTEAQFTDDQAAIGRVIGQEPKAGTKLGKLGAVKLIIGKERTFKVPSLVGKSEDAARSELASLGYNLDNLTVNQSTIVAPPGQYSFVAAQIQSNGSELLIQSEIPVSTPITLTLYAPEPPPSSASVPSSPAPSTGAPSQGGPSQSQPSQSSGQPGPGG